MHNFKIIISSILLLTIIIYITPCTFAMSNYYTWSTVDLTVPTISQSNQDDNKLSLESGSAILIEQSTGQVLYSYNAHEQLRPASVTKVMSLLLIWNK